MLLFIKHEKGSFMKQLLLLLLSLYCCSQARDVKGFSKGKKGVIFDKDGFLPIHRAVQSNGYNSYLALKAIVDKGNYDVDIEDQHGKTALYYVGESYNIDSFVYLIQKGANFKKAADLGMDITKINKSGGRALLHLLADHRHFDLIINLGLTPKQINTPTRDNKKTVLHYAVAKPMYSLLPEHQLVDPELFDRLIAAGCRLNIREKSKAGKLGPLPIELALRERHLEMFKYLYKKMQEDPVAQSLLRNKNVRNEIKKKGSKDIKTFVSEEEKKAEEKVEADKKVKQEEDDNDEEDKAIVKKVEAEQTSKKRKLEEGYSDDDNDDKTKVKRVKVGADKKGKGKKK